MRYITLQFLKDHGACSNQVRAFKRLFPSGRAALTYKNAEKCANKIVGGVDWLMDILLGDLHANAYVQLMDKMDDRREEVGKAEMLMLNFNVPERTRQAAAKRMHEEANRRDWRDTIRTLKRVGVTT